MGFWGGGGGLICGGAEKLDLKKMIGRAGGRLEIPSVFICPISLEPMQDPVTLCTGQTYERSTFSNGSVGALYLSHHNAGALG
ncbi:hypothetical protein M0R45_011839 [Rubus argutus]|uniref:U-box domain-containing protein n=1 Tax=Rubus argutus TaxID=59490 RepID=A0AAW1YCD4_RUBAR